MVVTMGDPDTALAAIKAAGDDFQSLYEAIKKAEFLDATPGDHRQAYRAAKSKLKKIHLAAKKKAEEDAKKGIVAKVSAPPPFAARDDDDDADPR